MALCPHPLATVHMLSHNMMMALCIRGLEVRRGPRRSVQAMGLAANVQGGAGFAARSRVPSVQQKLISETGRAPWQGRYVQGTPRGE